MDVKTIDQMDIKGKRVLMRAEFNVPVDDAGNITDDTRIRAALPTIQYALEQNAKLIVCAHRGRPKGRRVPELTLKPAADRLAELLGKPVTFVEHCIGAEVADAVAAMEPGDILMLENMRFHPGEESQDMEFAGELAALADVYISDAFGCVHRAHVSSCGVAKCIDHVGVGFLVQKEIEVLGAAMANPEQPFVLVIGGAKVSGKSGKIRVIENMLDKVDKILIGGKIAFTFLAAQGKKVGNSLGDQDGDGTLTEEIQEDLRMAKKGLEEAVAAGKEILLPVDGVVADRFHEDAESKTVSVDEIPDGWLPLDIGPETVKLFDEEIRKAKTIIWNGPMGVFEMDKFKKGTMALAETVASADANSIVGGGDSVSAINEAGVADKISHISTGGGAMLELLMGIDLPGIAVLRDR